MEIVNYDNYKNALELSKYRGISSNKKSKVLSEEEFITELNKNNFVSYFGYNEKRGEEFAFIITNPKTVYDKASYSKFASKLSKDKIDNILIFTDKLINAFSDNKILEHIPFIEVYTYDKIVFNLPEQEMVDQHILLTYDEFDKEFAKYRFTRKNIPQIPMTDPMCVWVGGRVGEFVKIKRKSYITGTSINYRIIT